MVEAGMPDMEIHISYSLYAPVKTPRAALKRLQKEVAAVIHTPAMIAILEGQAASPIGNSVTEFNQQIQREAGFWERLVKETGIEAE